METERRIYRGWIVTAASFMNYMVVWGGVWYSFPVFYRIFLQEYHWGRSETVAVFSVCASLVFLLAPLAGMALDRYGPRPIMPAASLFLGFALFLCSQIHSLSAFYLYYGIGCAIGMSFLLFTPQTAILSRWFQTHRGTALGISLSGSGAGMILIIPLIEWVSSQMGWRNGFLLLSGLVLFLVLPANIFLIRFPKEGEIARESGLLFWLNGVRPDKKLIVVDPVWTSKIWTPRDAIRTRRFWYLYLAGTTGMGLVVQTIFSHFMVMTTEIGYSTAFSSKMLGLAGFMGAVGFLFWGKLGDWIGREWSYTLGTASLFVGLLFLFHMKWTGGITPFILFAALFGFGYGSRSPLMQSIFADIFQGPYFSSIFGLNQMLLTVIFVGPWLAGAVASYTKSYQPIILVFLGLLVLSTLLIWLAAPRDIRRLK